MQVQHKQYSFILEVDIASSGDEPLDKRLRIVDSSIPLMSAHSETVFFVPPIIKKLLFVLFLACSFGVDHWQFSGV